ncbi:hypothetical protein [Chondrinema litorale]|uniref:hypothetical protein n=1 Tax=Chondrinema litorale TaxID=2994555 RepID=UPI0025430E21|nr:hypothetical protein [Chondrinema litorale]UZR99921.1 hypothetical protein OQ292_38765 [Chondrinema litorale]
MKYLIYYLTTSILFFSLIASSAFAGDHNIKTSERVKATLKVKGITLEEIGDDLYMLKGETPIIIFDKKAQYVIELVAENHLTIESELSYAEIVFGSENVYVSFYNKEKEKVEKVIF